MGESLTGFAGRLAPSPTGALHLGNIRTFMIAWLKARSQGGRVALRIEDLDHPRDKPGAASELVEELRWLGFDWDAEFVQSKRRDIYRHARDLLIGQGLIYPCVCSRRDVESAQSAPHAGEQLHYPGICRGRFRSWQEASAVHPPCWRFRVGKDTRVEFDDEFCGVQSQLVDEVLGDFPLARDEDCAGYTMAVVVDDLLMGIGEVVRADDLLAATPAQILVAKALIQSGDAVFAKAAIPRWCHVPLVVGRDGKRLAKRHGDTRVASFRRMGWSANRVIGLLAASCGWAVEGEEVGLVDLLPRFSLDTIPITPFCFESLANH